MVYNYDEEKKTTTDDLVYFYRFDSITRRIKLPEIEKTKIIGKKRSIETLLLELKCGNSIYKFFIFN